MLCPRCESKLSSVVWILNPAAVEKVCLLVVPELTYESASLFFKLIQTQKVSMVPLNALFPSMLLLFVNQKIIKISIVASEVI